MPSHSINGPEKSSWLPRQAIQQLREKVITILSDRMSPQRLEQVEQALQSKDMARRDRSASAGRYLLSGCRVSPAIPAGDGIFGTCRVRRWTSSPTSTRRRSAWSASRRDFGIPHPELAQTYGRELLNVKPFPAFSGYSSRLFGESWDSTNLYWARLADERSDSPVMLNVLSPQLTRLMVSKIFADDYEDWPAVVRAMHEAGDDFLQGKVGPAAWDRDNCSAVSTRPNAVGRMRCQTGGLWQRDISASG